MVGTEADADSALGEGLAVDVMEVESCPVVIISGEVDRTDVSFDSVVKTGANDAVLRVESVEEAKGIVVGLLLIIASLVDEDDVGIELVVSVVVWMDAAVVRTGSTVIVFVSVTA